MSNQIKAEMHMSGDEKRQHVREWATRESYMAKPNFLHIGAAKAASSWLWRICQEHPDVYVPETPDNVNFFTMHYHRGMAWYERTYFSDWNGESAIGEFSNSYMVFPPAVERIASELPGVRLTAILRNPVERAFLSWAHQHLKGKPNGLDARRGIGIPFTKVLHHYGHSFFRLYLDPGFYGRHLERILQHIGRERVLVLLYDDLVTDNAACVQRYFDFLEVDPDFQPSLVDQIINPDAQDAAMDDWVPMEFRRELRDVYSEDIACLERLVGRDLDHWR